jgi:hypothetical protein
VKSPFLPPPALEDLRSLRIHEAVRDYPELLPVLAPPQVSMERRGTRLLSEVIQEVPAVGARVLSLLSWRGRGGL